MNSTRPAEITWSLMHPTPLDPAYMARVAREAGRYRVDSFEICAECHNLNGGLDGLLTYDEYPDVAAGLDFARIRENRDRLRAILDIAHRSGRPVYYWHREVMAPAPLLRALPGLLDENGEFDLLGEAYTGLIRYKIRRALADVPDLDGLVLTLTEADYSVIHSSSPERYPPDRVVAHLVGAFADELAARGKRFILRSFGSIARDYEDILAGAARAAQRRAFEVETKITPYDFNPFLPPNPFLRRLPGATLGAECDVLGEFLGAGFLPAANVERIVAYVREGQRAGVDRFALRVDRIGNSIFDSAYEINLRAYHAAIDDPAAEAGGVWRAWAAQRWPNCAEEMQAVTAQGIRVVERTNYISGNLMFHMFPLDPGLKWAKAGGVFALFHEGAPLAWQSGIWSILSEQSAPASRANIIREKDAAAALAAAQLETLRALRPRLAAREYAAAEREWEMAVRVAELYGHFCRCVAAYFDDMEAGGADSPRLTAARAAAERKLTEYLGAPAPEAAGVTAVSDAIEHHAMQPRADPLRTVYAAPLRAMLAELEREFAAEARTRQAWRARGDAADVVLFGAIGDEWRIRRHMHASHAALHNGRPSRVVGNRIFPNGYVECPLHAPPGDSVRLILEFDPAAARALKLTVANQARIVESDVGRAELTVPAGPERPLVVRLEKHGADYPRVYALAALKDQRQGLGLCPGPALCTTRPT